MAVGTRGRSKKPAGGDADTPAFGGIAERFRRAGDLDKAIALCREGLKKFPDQISGRVTLGWALLDKGSYDEAQGELEYALKRAPDNLAAIRGLAELHERAENTLMLPMDGPGQWPPDAAMIEDAVEAIAEEPVAAAEPEPDLALEFAIREPEPEPEPEPELVLEPAAAASMRTHAPESVGYDTAPVAFTRASDTPPEEPAARPHATIDIDPPMSDEDIAALAALVEQEEKQAAAAAAYSPAAIEEIETPIEALAYTSTEAPVEIPVETPVETMLAIGDLAADLAALEELEELEVAAPVAMVIEPEVASPVALATTEEPEIAAELTFSETPEPIDLSEAAALVEALEASEPEPAVASFQFEEELPSAVLVHEPTPAEEPVVVAAEPVAETIEPVEIEIPAAMSDASASEDFPEQWTTDATASSSREREIDSLPDMSVAAMDATAPLPDRAEDVLTAMQAVEDEPAVGPTPGEMALALDGFDDHFQSHGPSVHDAAAYAARHDEAHAPADESPADRFDDLHAPAAAADVTAFAAREVHVHADHDDGPIALPDVEFAAPMGGGTEDFAARLAESALTTSAASAAATDEVPDLRGSWAAAAVELEPSSVVVPESLDVRADDSDEDEEDAAAAPAAAEEEEEEDERQAEAPVVAVAAAVAVADVVAMPLPATTSSYAKAPDDKSPFAKAPDDKSPASRLRRMLRRIELLRLETARESVA